MVHGDDRGLVLPPRIAPIQVIIIPIGNDLKVEQTVDFLSEKLREENISYKIDCSNKTPGFKFAQAEVKGYPVRVEVGKRDLESNCVTLVRRDTLEKYQVSIQDAVKFMKNLFDDIQKICMIEHW